MFDQFINRGVINEVIRIIKSGKEAEIYLTVRHKKDRDIYVVSKVHLDKKHRNFKNEQVYRAGWQMVGKANQRAIDRMTRYGQQYIQKRWVMEEWNALRTLWKEGASVPTPVTVNDGVILMRARPLRERGSIRNMATFFYATEHFKAIPLDTPILIIGLKPGN